MLTLCGKSAVKWQAKSTIPSPLLTEKEPPEIVGENSKNDCFMHPRGQNGMWWKNLPQWDIHLPLTVQQSTKMNCYRG